MSGYEQSAVVVGSAILATLLAAIAYIDIRRFIIPNVLNLVLGAAGLCVQFAIQPGELPARVAFAIGFGLLFWLVRELHYRLRGAVGLGLGDVKMAAAAAIWVSPMLLPVLLFLSSASALLFAGARAATVGSVSTATRIPFGPFLAIGLAGTWMLEQYTALGEGLIGW
jgi:leader peptidase (prepilin peptidase)/N-methyltransferase